jgi:hypothetical protein
MVLTTLKIVTDVVDLGGVPVPHTGQVVYALDPKGRRWVRKYEENTGFQEFLSEALGWLLAKRIGASVPDAALTTVPEKRSWLSRCIEPAVHWDATCIDRIDNVADLGAMLVLDVLILNEDRHQGNVLLQATGVESKMQAWAIDHGAALIGWSGDFSARKADIPSTGNLLKGLQVDLLEAHAIDSAEKVTQLPKSEILAIVGEACAIVQESDVERIADVLSQRCLSAPTLIKRYLKAIRDRK